MPLDKNTSRNIHMLTVTASKSEFKLGRGHESEVRINDISVSRCHAIIKCKKDGFYIEDNLSKFGTIVLLKDKMRLAEDHTAAVQVGRSVVSFTIKNIDAREKLRREIEPLLARNKNKVLIEKTSSAPHDAGNIRSNSEERNEDETLHLLNSAGADEFANVAGNRPAREAGKSMNPPVSRGGNIRNGFDGPNGRQSLLNENSPYQGDQ